MALNRSTRYPGRFNTATTGHPQGSFKNRTSPTSQDGSYLEADWANDWDGFFGSLLSAAGLTPDGNVDAVGASQYYNALSGLFARLTSPVFTGDPKAPTPAAGDNDTSIATTAFVQSALSGIAVPVGMPMPWPTSTPPTGWINCMGQTITQAAYPQLYAVYGAALPDLRANVIRGWDNGRGIDTGRVLLSEQTDAIRNITGWIVGYGGAGAEGGAFSNGAVVNSLGAGQNGMYRKDFNASLVVPTAAENRVRNIAFNYIVRAA